MGNISQRAGFPTELKATIGGGTTLIGTLTNNPVIIMFDNQGSVDVSISVNDSTGVTVWKTFPAGEGLVLDLRGNHGIASNFTIDQGTSFYGKGSGGVFSISYLYAFN